MKATLRLMGCLWAMLVVGFSAEESAANPEVRSSSQDNAGLISIDAAWLKDNRIQLPHGRMRLAVERGSSGRIAFIAEPAGFDVMFTSGVDVDSAYAQWRLEPLTDNPREHRFAIISDVVHGGERLALTVVTAPKTAGYGYKKMPSQLWTVEIAKDKGGLKYRFFDPATGYVLATTKLNAKPSKLNPPPSNVVVTPMDRNEPSFWWVFE